MQPGIIDELWVEFRSYAESNNLLPSSPAEWCMAYPGWRLLDPDQKRKAIEYLRTNDGMETTHSTVVSFLRMQKYLRPVPKARVQKPKALDGALARLREGR